MRKSSGADGTEDRLPVRHPTLWWRRLGSENNLLCQRVIISNGLFKQRRCCDFSHYVFRLLFIIVALCSIMKSCESVISCLNLIDGAAAENVAVDVT